MSFAPLPERPCLSIIVPSYGQGAYIADTLDSVLSQAYRPVEILVVDGGSGDDTLSVLQCYDERSELSWISEPDRGVADAVNKGFKMAKGEILAVQSSDDTYLEGAFEAVVSAFHEHPRAGLIYGDAVKVDAQGAELSRHVGAPFSLEGLLLRDCTIPQPAAFFRRDILDTVGDWDEDLPYTPDTDMWLRIAFNHDVFKLDRFLATRRMHAAQRDTQCASIVRDYRRMLEKSEGLRSAGSRLRRASRAGMHRLQLRYNVRRSTWSVLGHLLAAGWHRPDRMPWMALWNQAVYYPLHRLASRMKRSLRGAAVSGE